MFPKIRSLAFMLLLMMLFSGVVSGQDKPSGNTVCHGGTGIELSSPMGDIPLPIEVKTPGEYKGEGFTDNLGEKSKNLLIGGIQQNGPDPDQNQG